MAKRERIYRGFVPDDDGDRTIRIDGEQIRGRWVYGMPSTDGRYILDDFGRPYRLPGETHDTLSHSAHLVVPETVGEWTGLTDRAGNKIYEDDIIEACFKPGQYGVIRFGVYKNPFNDDKFAGHAGFYVEGIIGDEKDITRKDLGYWCLLKSGTGNIWENPDLLDD